MAYDGGLDLVLNRPTPAFDRGPALLLSQSGGGNGALDTPKRRFGGQIFDLALDPSTYTSWRGAIGRKLPLGRIGVAGLGLGAGALGGAMAAAGELNNPDPTVSNAQRLGGAAGAGLGTAAGTTVGAVLGGMTPLGPLGSLIGGYIGGSVGSMGGALGRNVVGAFGPSVEDKALASYEKQAAAQTAAEAQRMTALLPIQQRAAEFATANEIKRARDLQAIQSIASAMQAQQAASAQQAALTTQGLFSGLGLG